MRLASKLNALDTGKWKYYSNFPCKDYSKAIQNPLDFVRKYFEAGNKGYFLPESIFSSADPENLTRAKHVVNAYFLGVYLYVNINQLQFNPKSFLGKGKNFLWAWFICSLYHDMFFVETSNNQHWNHNYDPNYEFCYLTKGLLYDQYTISNYYQKQHNPETSHNGEVNYDHGIIAASELYKNYANRLKELVRENNKLFVDFINDNNIYTENHKIINTHTYKSICRIAKIIACHNIYICSDDTQKGKYEKAHLNELICSDSRFRFQPKTKAGKPGCYEKLYFLLALVDTLESTKRKISMDNIDIEISYNDIETVLKIVISDKVSNEKKNKYLNGIKQLNSWLNFVKVNEQGDAITIDFNFDKNRQMF